MARLAFTDIRTDKRTDPNCRRASPLSIVKAGYCKFRE